MSSRVEDAEGALSELADAQAVLATLAFKYGVSLTPRQREIVKDFDRSDLAEERARVFDKIRRGEFPWVVRTR